MNARCTMLQRAIGSAATLGMECRSPYVLADVVSCLVTKGHAVSVVRHGNAELDSELLVDGQNVTISSFEDGHHAIKNGNVFVRLDAWRFVIVPVEFANTLPQRLATNWMHNWPVKVDCVQHQEPAFKACFLSETAVVQGILLLLERTAADQEPQM